MRILIISLLSLFVFLQSCKDPCKDLNCNSGTCDDGTCICEDGFEGELCSIEKRAKFMGNWTGDLAPCLAGIPGAEQVASFLANTTITVFANANDINKVDVNINIPLAPVKTVGRIIENEILLENTSVDVEFGGVNLSILISGSGILVNDNQLNMDMVFSVPLAGNTECLVVLVK